MGIQDLQTFIESEGTAVDLFKISDTNAGGLQLVVDAEGCLDRLYGGFFSDWACGGQWARCVQFLTTLATAMAEHHVTLTVCFNGSHPTPPAVPHQWLQMQASNRHKINSVLRHISMKGTPPPKVWWVPPIGLHSCLRIAIRYLNIAIMVSSDDHCQEVVSLCREKAFSGIVGNCAQYLIFQPPRYFSASQLKLTYRSSLETKEYKVEDLPRLLDVPASRLSLVGALLGDTHLTEGSLTDFYKKLNINLKKVTPEELIKTVCQFVRELPSSDIDTACVEIFGDLNDLRAAKLKEAVQYYQNGSKEGFFNYWPSTSAAGRRVKTNKKQQNNQTQDIDTSKLATESSEHEQKGLEDYKLATLNASLNADFSLENPSQDLCSGLGAMRLDADQIKQDHVNNSNNRETNVKRSSTKEARQNNKQVDEDNCPPIPPEVFRTCAERHSRGLMHPHMLSILAHRQILLPVVMEDDHHREIPPIHHFFRPIRQNVYAILHNMHHHRFMAQKAKDEGVSSGHSHAATVMISEWIYSRANPGNNAEIVPGVILNWPVPTVQRLWFGTAQDDKCRRMRAFLSCMRSDTPLILNTAYVPRHLLILATVLRFIMSSQVQILRRQELDAFLATAFSADLMNALQLQELTLSGISSRGVQLAALVMAGTEMALLANDACGAPVPWLASAPWLFTDGKLLQDKLARAMHCKHLTQLCDGNFDTVVKVERMRKAILEDLEVEFAMPPLPMAALGLAPSYHGALSGWGAPRGRGRSARLEIAGVVVGQWGDGSYPSRGARYTAPMNYVSYTPTPRNAYGGRGWRGGRGRGRSARAPRRQSRARDQEEPTRPATLSINGKTVRAEEVLDQNEDGSPQQDDSSPEMDNNGAQKPAKGIKNGKKAATKNKKKTVNQKSEVTAPDSNGPKIIGNPSLAEQCGQGDAMV